MSDEYGGATLRKTVNHGNHLSVQHVSLTETVWMSQDVWVSISISHKDTSQTGWGFAHMTSSYLNYLFKGPISRCSHILRCPAHKDSKQEHESPDPSAHPPTPLRSPSPQDGPWPADMATTSLCGLSRLPCFFRSRGTPLLLLSQI